MNSQDFADIINAAIKAPSAHNTQPWKFRIDKRSIEIHPDFARHTPVADPDGRELYISLGCAAENLCIAASEKHYLPIFSVHNNDGNTFIKVTLNKEESTTDFK